VTDLARAVDAFWAAAVGLVWGLPLVVGLISAGLYFTLASGFAPIRYLGHALSVLTGRYDDARDPGEITHFQALSSALSATVGMGNLGGVAIAVTTGGPGAIFWMWIAGLVGMATKFFTCTLACMYRKEDAKGVVQGGPMYFIEVGLGPRWRPLAMMFALCGMVGCLGLFQINQIASLLDSHYSIARPLTGVIAMLGVGAVILGGIARVGRVAARLVPAMVVLYLAMAFFCLFRQLDVIPGLIAEIISAAFSGGAVLGGAAGVTVKEALITGVRRAAFSNEAGIGTAALAHGAARTREPVREGLVAMLGPFIDTNIVCTLTALVILSAGVVGGESGVALTARAFESSLPGVGAYLVTLVMLLFGFSTMVSYSYYSQKCARYLLGESIGERYIYVYLATLPIAAIWSQATVVNVLDTAFALMAVPTLTGTLLLSPRVVAATRDYFDRRKGATGATHAAGEP
jgi:AGCS family alanine or glycine:cation symporter